MKTRALIFLIAVVLVEGCGFTLSMKDLSNQSGSAPSSPSAPTASKWAGVNVSADFPYADLTRILNPFNSSTSQEDANGFPLAGVSATSATDIGWEVPTGTYLISYQGTGSVTVSGIGSLQGAWQTVGTEHRNAISITGTPFNFGNFLNVAINNSSGQTVTDLHIFLPGYGYDTSQLFSNQFLSLLAPFRALRFMVWMNTNGSTLANWTDRSLPNTFGVSPAGQPYENLIALINQTGKDAWINIPEHASVSFVTQLADLFRDGLNFAQIDQLRAAEGITTPFQLIIEFCNESWNSGFTCYNTLTSVVQSNPQRYPGNYNGAFGPSWMSQSTALMQVAEAEADSLVRTTQIFKSEFSTIGMSSVIQPMLSGWQIGAAYSDAGLQFIQSNYGPPRNYVSYVGGAFYFGPDDSQTGDLNSLFTSMATGIQGNLSALSDFNNLSQQYGIQNAAYEGGSGISGNANLRIKHLAQFDQRMYQSYLQAIALWKQTVGESLLMQYALSGGGNLPETIGQYGWWDIIGSVFDNLTTCGQNLPLLTGSEDPATVTGLCPKYRAWSEQVGN